MTSGRANREDDWSTLHFTTDGTTQTKTETALMISKSTIVSLMTLSEALASASGEALIPVSAGKSAEKRTRQKQPSLLRPFISDLLFGSPGPSSPESQERTLLSVSARGRASLGEMGRC